MTEKPIRSAGVSLMSDGWYAILSEAGDHNSWVEVERNGPFNDKDLAYDVAESHVGVHICPPRSKPTWEDHPDDPYIDEIRIDHVDHDAYRRNQSIEADMEATDFGISSITMRLKERYKTSGLSGDEWRFSAVLEFWKKGGEEAEIEDHLGSMNACVAKTAHIMSAIIFDREREKPENEKVAVVIMRFYRRGQMLFGLQFNNLVEAASSLPWWWLTWMENHEIPSERFQPQEEGYCCQPGCQEKGVVVYRIKKKFEQRTGRRVRTSGMWHHHRRFCEKHALRGDCGLEDADVNYELIEGEIQPGGGRVDPCVVTKSRQVQIPLEHIDEVGDKTAMVHDAIAAGSACECPVCGIVMVPGLDHVCPRGEGS